MADAADCLWTEKGFSLPSGAQVALQQAAFLERQIRRSITEELLDDFQYTDRGALVALSTNPAVGSLMGKAPGTMALKGWLARRAYKFLHHQYEAAIQGCIKALLRTVVATEMRRVRPRLKLH